MATAIDRPAARAPPLWGGNNRGGAIRQPVEVGSSARDLGRVGLRDLGRVVVRGRGRGLVERLDGGGLDELDISKLT
ncbi:MAG: hypothetical protein WKF75_08920 [Singulisphaera sp.]